MQARAEALVGVFDFDEHADAGVDDRSLRHDEADGAAKRGAGLIGVAVVLDDGELRADLHLTQVPNRELHVQIHAVEADDLDDRVAGANGLALPLVPLQDHTVERHVDRVGVEQSSRLVFAGDGDVLLVAGFGDVEQ